MNNRMSIICCFFFIVCYSWAGNLSPLDYGLAEAHTGVERFEILKKTHKAAISQGCGVSYKGIKRIDLIIPQNATPIPLPFYTDFAGVEITTDNQVKDLVLFSLSNEVYPTTVNKTQIRKGRFRANKELRKGTKLMIIIDDNLWVKQRRGYNNGATRKDILCLKNGRAQNSVISSYAHPQSCPRCFFCDVTNQKVVIKDLVFSRCRGSRYLTKLFELKNLNNVLIRDIIINTPLESSLFGDTAIYIENSSNVTMTDITINGTYSLKEKYGYGIGMNNVWNSKIVRLKAFGNWGIFGNNNISHVTILDSDINRFDIHCYGKDVFCYNTIFRELYNQFSSLYGVLRFDNCQFLNFVPVLFEPSYSAYTHFNLELINCYIAVNPQKPYLINAGNPKLLADNPRVELEIACWPDIYIKDLTVVVPKDIKYWTLFYLKNGEDAPIFGLSKVVVDGLNLKGETISPGIKLSNKRVVLMNKLKTKIKQSSITVIE